ncbi:hypothetical protein THOM_1888 [Trachipleistophora hominis]|uniref:Uncharacterized protein n=1 Tax=Trachipleistophora hominis TaxID=72359 RepID=L7JUN0_TRAHO|nr:hypothetical protein THOM_1888 [Trachipleistophora hominis]
MINTLSTDSVVELTCKDVRDDLIQQDIPRGMHWGGFRDRIGCNNWRDCNNKIDCKDRIGCNTWIGSNNWRDCKDRREGGCKEPFNRFNKFNTFNTNTLNYPEIFNGNATQKGVPSDQHLQLRSLAQHYHTLHTTMTQLSAAHIKNKPLNNYYTDKAQHYKQCSLSLHKQAVIRLMAHKIRGNRIDLHDLYVWEGLMVLDDYVRVYGLNRFYVCVGRMEKSLRMRPEVIKYLGVRGFVVESEGAWLRVSKG